MFGGSFVSSKKNPRDIDCVIVFRKSEQIPPRIERLEIEEHSVDVFFASTDQKQLLASFRKLLSTSRGYDPVGIAVVHLRSSSIPEWNITWEPDDGLYEVVRRAYISRHYVDRSAIEKTLVTIHGIRTNAEWNAEVTLHASANGWTVAPFHYGYVEATVFWSRSKRREIVDKFRDFMADLQNVYDARNLSVIAHSFGTYVFMNYVLGFGGPPMAHFDTAILCGAIVDEKLDFDRLEGRVAHVVNERAPNDEWVEWAKKANLGLDETFGYAGTRGFSSQSSRLSEYKSDIFSHNNVIRRDVVTRRWLPMLEANRGASYREAAKKLIREARARS